MWDYWHVDSLQSVGAVRIKYGTVRGQAKQRGRGGGWGQEGCVAFTIFNAEGCHG